MGADPIAVRRDLPSRVPTTESGQIGQIVVVATASFLATRLCLFVDSSTGYTASAWGPAGLALACVISLGPRVAIGVWFGSLVALVTGADLDWAPTGILAPIVSSAVWIQILVSERVIRWWTERRERRSQDDLASVVVLGGPIGGSLAPALGTVGLWFFECLPREEIFASASVWWIGNVVGIAVFAPVFLLWERRPQRVSRGRRIAVTACLLVLFATAKAASYFAEEIDDRRLAVDFDRSSDAILNSAQKDLEWCSELVDIVRRFCETSRPTSEQFAAFARSKVGGCVQALEWIARVDGSERDEFVAAVRVDGRPDYEIRDLTENRELLPADVRDEYFPVLFAVPGAENARAFGLDLASDSTRRAALESARDSGRAVATARITLVEEQRESAGVLLFQPAYRTASVPETVEERRRHLLGFALGVLRVDDVLGPTRHRLAAANLSLGVRDVTDGINVPLLEIGEDQLGDSASRTIAAAQRERTDTISIGDRRWSFRFRTTPAFSRHRARAIFPVVSVVAVILVMSIAWTLLASLSRAWEMERLIVQLSYANADLERSVEKRKQAERSLNEARLAAEYANELKSTFIANVSHEIRTPLTAIIGYSDLLLEAPESSDAPSGEARDHVSTIRNTGEYLLTLINDLLDLSKIRSGHLEVTREPCSPIQLVEEVVDLLRVPAAEKGLQIIVKYLDSVPETIETDPIRFRQILTNLIGNAVKFTDEGRVEVRVSILESLSDFFCVEVRDSGIGIEPDDLNALFEPFSQANGDAARKYGGTGLGLSISKELSILLGGGIVCQSQPGSGSSFLVSIDPGSIKGVRRVEDPAAEWSRRRATEQRTESSVRKVLDGARVLVVDDVEANRLLVSRVLERAGAATATAASGEQGIESTLRADEDGEPFDLILMDIQMPGLDGFSATEELLRRRPESRIVALTAMGSAEAEIECLRAGCVGCVRKPFHHRELIQTVVDYVDGLPDSAGELQSAGGRVVGENDGASDSAAFVDDFLQWLPEQLDTLRGAVDTLDRAAIEPVAHSLVGIAGVVGCSDIQVAAEHALEATVNGDDECLKRCIATLIEWCDTALACYSSET